MATQYDYVFQDRGHCLREVRSGKLFPFRSISLTAGTPRLPGNNKRFFVRAAYISYGALAGDTGTELKIVGKVNSEDNILGYIVKTASIVDKDTRCFVPRLLLDREAAISFTAPNITTSSAWVTVCEVDDLA